MSSSMRINQRKQTFVKIFLVFILLGLLTYLHYFILKSGISEILHASVSGFSMAYLYSLLFSGASFKWKNRILTILCIVFIIAYFLAVILDPIMKQWLDKIFSVNTVSTFPESILTNSVCFLAFYLLWLLGLKVFYFKKK